jgi:hypothetical protein
MKKIFAALFLLLCYSTYAQVSDSLIMKMKPKKSFTLGVNGSYLLKNVFNNSQLDSITNPHILILRFGYKSFGIRAGIGGYSKNNLQSEAGFADNTRTTDYKLDLRVGVDYEYKFGSKINGYFGLDGIKTSKVYKIVEDSGFDVLKITDQFHGYGGGPSIGMSYLISSNFYIYTEAAFYFIKGTRDRATIYTNFPELNDIKLTESTSEIKSYLPTSIYLIYKF